MNNNNNNIQIFHRELGLPAEINRHIGATFKLQFSNHAKNACRNDRYGMILPPTSITVTRENIIECERVGVRIVKILVRVPHDDKNDVVIAFIPDFETGFVKTLWLNSKTDTHKTLDAAKYNRP